MITMRRIFSVVFLVAGLMAQAGLFAADDSPKQQSDAPAAAAAAKPEKTLTPEMTALRDQVRRVLAAYQNQQFNTSQNTATEIMNYCLGFGCATQVTLQGNSPRSINGITCLCWNYPCAGFELLGLNHDRVAPRIGYGLQEQPGEFLAMLAMSRVPDDYPIRSGKLSRTVADVVEAEKLACRAGSNLSLALVGLSYYVDAPEWKNDQGDTWTIERMVKEELAKPVVEAPEGGLNRLLGLSYAVARRAKRGEAIEGQFQRAEKFTADYQKFAFQLQNSDGSWGPSFLAARSNSQDVAGQLRSTGRILEWLAMSLPDGKLEDAHMSAAIKCVNNILSSQRYQRGAASVTTREIASVGHALHALSVYDDRVFKPADVVEQPAAEKPATPASAQRDAKSPQQR